MQKQGYVSRARAFHVLPALTGFVGQPGLARSTGGKLQGLPQADEAALPTLQWAACGSGGRTEQPMRTSPFLGYRPSKYQPVRVQEKILEH